ncbi:MAG: DUF3025 domain-containing protein [Sulfuricella denitrificans]|nr:DUF3025 domain-containing protein [Sulfuricella denitrificans]
MDEWRQNFLHGSPMFEPLRGVGSGLAEFDRWPTLAELNALLSPEILTASGVSVRFVAQGTKPTCLEEKYEARIYLRGEVQTRSENWHDLFNALAWLAFPSTKSALNARHFESITQSSEAGNRDKTRDALTLFDESGVVVLYSDNELAGLLQDFKWHELFWRKRQSLIGQMGFLVFGHSLNEKALNPYIGMTGKGLMIKVSSDFFSSGKVAQSEIVDELLTERFSSGLPISNQDLTPVPLLGVPGWCKDNRLEVFYENTGYFRPQIHSRRSS